MDEPSGPSGPSGPPEPRWLSADERQAWLAMAAVLMRLPAALDAQLQRDAGISHFGRRVMRAIDPGDPCLTARASGS